MPRLFQILSFCLLLTACRKDSERTEVIIIEEEPAVLVQSSFSGTVVDESGTPVDGALVQVAATTTPTDHNGQFHLEQLIVPKSGVSVRAMSADHFDGLVFQTNEAATTNYTALTLLDRPAPRSIDGAAGATLKYDDGSQLTIAHSAFQYTDGRAFDGPVNFTARWMDAEQHSAAMPAHSEATGEQGAPKVLTSFGMLILEANTEAGQKLELRSSDKLELLLPIPDGLRAVAPSSLRLWRFDGATDRWQEAGVATREGNYWQSDAGQLSTFQIAIAFDPICLSATLQRHDQSFASYQAYTIDNFSGQSISRGYTNQAGALCATIPAGVGVIFRVYDHCGGIALENEITARQTDVDLGLIGLSPNTQMLSLQMKGDVFECSQLAPIDGRLIVEYPGTMISFPMAHFDSDWTHQFAFSCTD
ncbi:MAG: carboxypeptidase-like regulatory domain-containing protein, partial [Bacteroidota bacterium]